MRSVTCSASRLPWRGIGSWSLIGTTIELFTFSLDASGRIVATDNICPVTFF
jgi:hypothetical protein